MEPAQNRREEEESEEVRMPAGEVVEVEQQAALEVENRASPWDGRQQ
jgi:hypothetical protein